MTKQVSAIRFEEDEKEWIAAFAEMYGKSFSALVREWTLERLEDELDARDLADALSHDDGVRYSTDEVASLILED